MSNHQSVVLNITNSVVQTQTANALLAIDASPIMSQCIEEISDILAFASAVNINIGTLNKNQIKLFAHTLSLANHKNIPVVFDPVGFGATTLRNRTVIDFLDKHLVSVIKGNASEIIALDQNIQFTSNSIDSQHEAKDAVTAAKNISSRYQTVVVVTGKVDYCVDENNIIDLTGGHPLMSKVTGIGCITNALIASFLNRYNPLEASESALCLIGNAGEIAGKKAVGPGSFMVHFLDALHLLTH